MEAAGNEDDHPPLLLGEALPQALGSSTPQAASKRTADPRSPPAHKACPGPVPHTPTRRSRSPQPQPWPCHRARHFGACGTSTPTRLVVWARKATGPPRIQHHRLTPSRPRIHPPGPTHTHTPATHAPRGGHTHAHRAAAAACEEDMKTLREFVRDLEPLVASVVPPSKLRQALALVEIAAAETGARSMEDLMAVDSFVSSWRGGCGRLDATGPSAAPPHPLPCSDANPQSPSSPPAVPPRGGCGLLGWAALQCKGSGGGSRGGGGPCHPFILPCGAPSSQRCSR